MKSNLQIQNSNIILHKNRKIDKFMWNHKMLRHPMKFCGKTLTKEV